MSVLKCIVNYLPVTDIPELVVKYLAGDVCLDDETVNTVFVQKFTRTISDRIIETYLDKDCTVPHSFNDEPAIEFCLKEQKLWCFNGKLHRGNDLPAFSDPDVQEWWQRGKRHRENDLPASIYFEVHSWFQNGILHRGRDLPAVLVSPDEKNGHQEWWCQGKLHRENDMPAICDPFGVSYWYTEGRFIKAKDSNGKRIHEVVKLGPWVLKNIICSSCNLFSISDEKDFNYDCNCQICNKWIFH